MTLCDTCKHRKDKDEHGKPYCILSASQCVRYEKEEEPKGSSECPTKCLG